MYEAQPAPTDLSARGEARGETRRGRPPNYTSVTPGIIRRPAGPGQDALESLGKRPAGKKCHAIEGLIEEGKTLMEENAEPAAMDAGLIAAAQKVEHYEIASYGCARTWASQLGYGDASKLLQETLDEEGETDKKLTKLAEGLVNSQAAELASTG